MQELYRSLDPANAAYQESDDRRRIYNLRVDQARGGEISDYLGLTFGATASIYLYSRYQRNTFALLPLQRHKLVNYSALFLAGYLGSKFG